TLVGTTAPITPAAGYIRSFNSGASLASAVAFGPGTRSEYLDEYVVGFEHEFGNSGVIFTARYTDRRIKRIIEDNAELSPEAGQGASELDPNPANPCSAAKTNGLGCSFTQFYTISNVNKNQDAFTNPTQID